MKQCRVCGEWKLLSEFYKTRKYYLSACKECIQKRHRQYYQTHKEEANQYREKYYQAHKEHYAQYRKEYYKTHKRKYARYCKAYREKYKEHFILYDRKYGQTHRKEINEYRKQKRKIDPKFKLNRDISRVILRSLKGNKNGRHWESLVGYTVNDLIKHLKKTLPKGYTLQDFMDGSKLHIEHIIPISAFNFDNYNQIDFKRCWALSNLRLLPAHENFIKSNKIDTPFQPSLKI